MKIDELNIISNFLREESNQLSSINLIIKDLVCYANADGAILWELNPATNHLFTVAHWFYNNDRYSVHDLPFDSSQTGNAIKNGMARHFQDLNEVSGATSELIFWEKFCVKSFIVVPIGFRDKNIGSLNFYYTKTNNAKISQGNIKKIARIANFFPDLYQSLHNRITSNLISNIHTCLQKTEISDKAPPLSKDDIKLMYHALCKVIENSFQCFETSIFLKDPFSDNNVFERIASTWQPDNSNQYYKASEEFGLTGWILHNRKAVKITDLSLFWEQQQLIQEEYPSITWLARGDIRSAVAEKLGIVPTKDTQLPPMSFIGVPVIVGDEVFGVVRCCAATSSPYYFGPRELNILSLVATRIGYNWQNWIQQHLRYKEELAWKEIVRSTSELDLFVLEELERDAPNVDGIFDKLLACLPCFLDDAEILDIRLLNNNGELHFAATYGEEWHKGTELDIISRREKTFSVDEEVAGSAGAHVFKTGKTLVLDPIIEGNPYHKTFENTKKMIVAPLLFGKKVLGVLDVRSTKERHFPPTATQIIELMGRQLAVYYGLLTTIKELRNLQTQQIQTFQDFIHQFRGPIYQATVRARNAVSVVKSLGEEIPDQLVRMVNATSGLCNKANRVAKNIRIFSDLAQGYTIKVYKTVVQPSQIIKLLIETSADNKMLINPRRDIKIDVDRNSFITVGKAIDVDIDLFEQTINVLLDNAIKYSYSKSSISVYCELTKRGRFQIIFKNQGIPIREEEAALCKLRGWRSPGAKMTTGEGGGIGLWVVDHIMKAHGGDLIVQPTDIKGFTIVKIIFPIKN